MEDKNTMTTDDTKTVHVYIEIQPAYKRSALQEWISCAVLIWVVVPILFIIFIIIAQSIQSYFH